MSEAAGVDVEDAVDALYAGEPEAFVPARDELVRRLRSEGGREAATAVKRLRRPTVAAWAVNQLARQAPGDVDALIASGERLRQAQRRALSGVRDTGLRDVAAERRELLDRLVRRAEAMLGPAGAGSSHVEAVRGSLEAASLDADVAAQVSAGRLSKEVPRPAGFGDVAALALVADERGRDGGGQHDAPAAEPPEPAGREATDEGRKASQRQAAALQQALHDARARVARRQAEVETAKGEASQRRREADEAEALARRAAQEAETARRRAEEVARRAEGAQRRLDKATRQLAREQAALERAARRHAEHGR